MPKIKKILECVCFSCGRLKVNDRNPTFERARRIKDRKKRFRYVWTMAKAKMVCEMDEPEDGDEFNPDRANHMQHHGCGATQPLIRKDGLKLYAVFKKQDENVRDADTKQLLTPEKVLSIFKRISDRDCIDMGLSIDYARPDWMVITVLPVPPPQVRPSVSMDGMLSSLDDLTHKLADVLKANNTLRKFEAEGAPAHIVQEFEQLLQWHVATYFDNDGSAGPPAMQKSGRPVSISFFISFFTMSKTWFCSSIFSFILCDH